LSGSVYQPIIIFEPRPKLFEVSTVNVPANQMALAKSKGIDTTPLEKHLNIEAIEKEGRVLSAKNRTAVENAVAALNQVLEADQGKTLSNDTAVQPQKVETPRSKGVTHKSSAKLINQAVRALLQAKRISQN
jgi:hypothetical protein